MRLTDLVRAIDGKCLVANLANPTRKVDYFRGFVEDYAVSVRNDSYSKTVSLIGVEFKNCAPGAVRFISGLPVSIPPRAIVEIRFEISRTAIPEESIDGTLVEYLASPRVLETRYTTVMEILADDASKNLTLMLNFEPSDDFLSLISGSTSS